MTSRRTMAGRDRTLLSLITEIADDRRSEAVRLVQQLVATPSYSGHEGRAHDPGSVVGRLWSELAGHVTALAVDPVTDDGDNLIEVVKGGEGPTFVIEAHTDAVPEGDPRRWMECGPFAGALGSVEYLGGARVGISVGAERAERTIRDKMARIWELRSYRQRSIVYGRGSFDNKGAVVSLALANDVLSRALGQVGCGLAGTLVSAYTVNEEVESSGVRRLACGKDSWLATHGYMEGPRDERGFLVGIYGAALDGSYGWVPVVGHRGALQLAVTTHGRAAHASTPTLGVNAVEGMSRVLVALTDGAGELCAVLNRQLNDSLVGPTSIAVGTTIVGGGVDSVSRFGGAPRVMRGGVNSIPDWCEATLDVRFPPGPQYPDDVRSVYATVLRTVRDFLSKRIEAGAWTWQVEPIEESANPPVAMAPTLEEAAALPMVRHLRRRAAQILGHDVPLEIAPGGTDATFMVHEAGIPTLVELGPAGALSHDTHEYVEVDDVVDGAKILAMLALDLIGTVA